MRSPINKEGDQISKVGGSSYPDLAEFLRKLENAERNVEIQKFGLTEKELWRAWVGSVKERVCRHREVSRGLFLGERLQGPWPC